MRVSEVTKYGPYLFSVQSGSGCLSIPKDDDAEVYTHFEVAIIPAQRRRYERTFYLRPSDIGINAIFDSWFTDFETDLPVGGYVPTGVVEALRKELVILAEGLAGEKEAV